MMEELPAEADEWRSFEPMMEELPADDGGAPSR